MSRALETAGSWIDRIRINSIRVEVRNGRTMWLKQRRPGSGAVIHAANAFFRLARTPVSVWRQLDLWQRWEVDSFCLLHGDRFEAYAAGRRGVYAEQVPGESVCRLLDARRLNREIMASAGCELRRAHGLQCSHYGGPWSHGDAHLGNFIFDLHSGRCRLIDFEVCHDRALSAAERHADDLLVPLLDLVGRADPEEWVGLALAFLNAYEGAGATVAVERVRHSLVIPAGAGRLWWWIRTNYLSRRELSTRLEALRSALE